MLKELVVAAAVRRDLARQVGQPELQGGKFDIGLLRA